MDAKPPSRQQEISLPGPKLDGKQSFEQTLVARRSVREYTDEPIDDELLSQLLWATQGVTDPEGLRAAPSAGALYPLELYVVTSGGCYHYDPARHRLLLHSSRDMRPALCRAALSQISIRQAPIVFVIASVLRRMSQKYGPEVSPRYIHMEIGHAAQNLLLQAVALDLGAVPIGAFHEERVRELMDLPADHETLYIVPVGRPR
jgi:SagB-type dehydrogenase family enzyme